MKRSPKARWRKRAGLFETGVCAEPDMLTPSELENLRRTAKEHSAFGKTAFKNHKVDLKTGGDDDFDARAEQNMLTPSELARLRRSTQEADAYLATAFKNHNVDLGARDDATLYDRPDQTAGDTPLPGVDPAAQEQPGTRRDGEAGRGRAPEDHRSPREA
ncbi:MAG: hypothetical protein LAT81_13900 [Oceanicaulis sp.]|nr:hypothetical protein [Oceanicaulis sp.]